MTVDPSFCNLVIHKIPAPQHVFIIDVSIQNLIVQHVVIQKGGAVLIQFILVREIQYRCLGQALSLLRINGRHEGFVKVRDTELFLHSLFVPRQSLRSKNAAPDEKLAQVLHDARILPFAIESFQYSA